MSSSGLIQIPTQHDRSQRFDAHIESLRGIAALAVVVCHALAALRVDAPALPLGEQPFAAQIVTVISALLNVNAAVMLFFVLSGYVLALSLDMAVGTAVLPGYLIRRAFRLLPPTWLSIGAMALMFWAIEHPSKGAGPHARDEDLGPPKASAMDPRLMDARKERPGRAAAGSRMISGASALAGAAWGVIAASPCDAAQYEIGRGARYAYHALNELNWARINPGDEIVIHAGSYATGAFQNIALPHGDATLPVTIHGAAGEAMPVLQDTLFIGAVGVTLQGVRVVPTIAPTAGAGDAISVANSSRGIVISDCEVSGRDQPRVPPGSTGGPSGINVFPGSSATIERNEVHDTQNDGIGVAKPAGPDPAPEPTLIRGNRIHHNKVHGIELAADNNSVLNNTVWSNGNADGFYDGSPRSELGSFGTSGIHISVGSNNSIGYNVVSDQRTRGIDGNGIEADNMANDNRIFFNVVYRNDGTGILVFHSHGNRVLNNTLYGNGRNSLAAREMVKGKFVPLAAGADLAIIGGDGKARSDDNVMANNLVYSVQPAIAGYVVTGIAGDLWATRGRNLVENNVFWSPNGAKIYDWTDARAAGTGNAIAAWNELKQTAWAGSPDFAVDPLLADPARIVTAPPSGENLATGPASPALVRCQGVDFGATTDIAGRTFARGRPPIGAYAPPTACPRGR